MNFLEYEKNHNKFLLALNENKNAQFSSILDTILSHDNVRKKHQTIFFEFFFCLINDTNLDVWYL